MRKSIRLALALVALTQGACASLSQQVDFGKVWEANKSAIVQVHTFGDDPGNTPKSVDAGVGVIVSEDGYILTALHVVGRDEDWYKDPNGKIHRTVEIRKSDGTKITTTSVSQVLGVDDLAIVRINGNGLPHASFESVMPSKFSQALAGVWDPKEQAPHPLHGTVTDTDVNTNGDVLTVVLPTVLDGYSGSPIWDASGNLLGIIKNRLDPARAAAIPIAAAIRFLPPGITAKCQPPKQGIQKVRVAVFDRNDHLIPNLPSRNFRIIENHTQPTILEFREVSAVSVAFLVQVTGRQTSFSPYNLVLSNVSSVINRLYMQDRVSIFSFASKLNKVAAFTEDHSSATRAIDALRRSPFADESNLFDALNELESQLKSVEGSKAVVIFTNGVDTLSKTTFAELRATVRANNIPIYIIKFWVPGTPLSQDDGDLKTLAVDSGGKYLGGCGGPFSGCPEEVNTAVSGYLISYDGRSNTDRCDGSDLKVELMDSQANQPLRLVDSNGADATYSIRVVPIP